MASSTTPGTSKASAWFKIHDEFSESAVALTFAEAFEAEWRFNTDDGMWLEWVGTHWARNRKHQILEAIRQMTARLAKGFSKAQRITEHTAIKFQSQRTVTAIETLCRSLPQFTITSDALDGNDFLLGTPAGTIDLTSGELYPARPEDYITILTPVSPAPPGTPCPDWQEFLDKVTADDRDLQRTLQQWSGNSAAGSARDQYIMFLYGEGRNGKGEFCNVVHMLLGDHIRGAPHNFFLEKRYPGHLTEKMGVLTSRGVHADEISKGGAWDIGLIKSLTGGGIQEARFSRMDLQKLRMRATITILGNTKPEVKDIDDAVRDRFLLVTFPVYIKPEERIVELHKKLVTAEGPAILRWIIDGAVDRERSGRLHIAAAIREGTKEYMDDENTLGDFIKECLETTAEAQEEADTGAVFEAGEAYFRAEKRQIPGKKAFTTAVLKATRTVLRPSNGRRLYRGLRLKNNDLSNILPPRAGS